MTNWLENLVPMTLKICGFDLEFTGSGTNSRDGLAALWGLWCCWLFEMDEKGGAGWCFDRLGVVGLGETTF